MEEDSERSNSTGAEPAPPRWMGLVVILVAFLVGGILAEVGARLTWRNPFHSEPSDYVLRIRMQHPNRDMNINRSGVYPDDPTSALRTDERGYILPSKRFEDPDLTIAFLGGSTTQCSAVDEELRFPALVSKLLEETGVRANPLNAAKAGNTTHDSLMVFLDRIVEDDPDVAVMMHAANDLGMLSRAGDYEVRTSQELQLFDFARWSLQEASSRSWLAGALRKWLTGGALMREPFEDRASIERETAGVDTAPFERRLRAFIGAARGFGIVPVLMTQPAVTMETKLTPDWVNPRNQQHFNDVVKRVALEENAVLIDLVEHVSTEVKDWNEPMEIFYDGIHVTNQGSKIYARHIADRLGEEVIPKLVSERASQPVAAR